ncbi:E3 ubiquitin-protein ligase ORTHRUS 2-like [Miscanthus floridulus]|uniref:E3 ubiquitin-protein ligase ORTHRUS 2-like n=1 Tax=Miscanthus floridulus TaxID=154761 RepID=UPI00345A970D
MAADFPCDDAGMCMVCGVDVESEVDLLRCSTCATPWHSPCLSNPPALSEAATWSCPDCSRDPAAARVAPAAGGELVAAIREIEADTTLSDEEKARRRQNLLAGRSAASAPDYVDDSAEDDVLNILGKSFSCAFCINLLDRPVTTPCGHNFCLKCFNGWTRKGKRACAKCRKPIPSKMVEQPRINSKMDEVIRKARMPRTTNSTGSVDLHRHYIQNVDKPDRAYTTDKAKRAGKANASSGKIFVTTAQDHFGPILPEHDPMRETGVRVGETWADRFECRQWGAHLPHIAGIAGQSRNGAQSVALSGGYEDDEDNGDWFLYTGSGGRDLSGNKRTNKEQGFDQTFVNMNEALRKSCLKGYPIRVVRSHKEKHSLYAPKLGVRYDGIYRIEKCWRKIGIQRKFKVCRYLFVRCDNEPAPWTSDGHGDRPRPLPDIPELEGATDINERDEQPSWGYDENKGCWKWMKEPPTRRKTGKQVRRRARSDKMSNAKRLLKGFSCSICYKVMTEPLSAPCGDNFCKTCLLGAYDNQSSVRERSSGGRSLRAQKIVKRCPSCGTDISDFLADPQINRDIMDVIESLQLKVEEGNTTKEVPYGGGDTDEEFQDDDQEEDDGNGMEMDEAGCSFNVEEGDNAEDHKDNPADMDDVACGKIAVGIKEEGQQPGQKRKDDTDVGTDGRPNKRMTTSAGVEQQNSKGDEADV